MERRHLLHLAIIGSLGLVAGCGAGGGPGGAAGGGRATHGVLDVARANNLASFLRAVEAAGLAEQLSGTGPYTVFAPSDAAFRALPAGRLTSLMRSGNQAELRRTVGYHVVPGMVTSSFMTGMNMNHLTATGGTLSVDGRGGTIRVNNANIVRRDLEAGNGVVHVVDRVLSPR